MNEVFDILKKYQKVGYSYSWIDRAYSEWLKNRKPTYENFKQFYLELLRLMMEGKIDLAQAGGRIREQLAKQRGLLALNRKMEKWIKRMLREGIINQAWWMYRIIE
jgi:hypothetical protein